MRYLAGLVWLLALPALPVRGDAAGFAADTMAIPLLAWVIAAIVAVVGGLTSILMRLAQVPPSIIIAPLAVGNALWMSLMSGAVGFLAGLMLDAGAPLMILLIFGASLGGTRILDALIAQVQARINAAP